MSDSVNNLYALAFDDEYKADEARALFKRMAGEGLLVLDQTAIVIVGIDGKASMTQDVDVTSSRRNQGHWRDTAHHGGDGRRSGDRPDDGSWDHEADDETDRRCPDTRDVGIVRPWKGRARRES
jgi:hypothetical protein